MSMFTDAELSFLKSQLLGRLATVDARGRPHVVPVGYRYDGEADVIVIGGHGLERSKKWRDLRRHAEAAFVVDDLVSTSPWTPRGIEVRGCAELHDEGGDALGPGFGAAWIEIRADRIVGWGLDPGAGHRPNARSVG